MADPSTPDCLVIGAGLSGLILAKQLQQQGHGVLVLDKGRGLGGRLATRRLPYPQVGEGALDYGAQYFQAQTQPFQTLVARWMIQGVVTPWFHEGEVPRYRGTPNNRAIAKFLAQGLRVQTQTQVTGLRRLDKGWQVETAQGDRVSAPFLALTAPVPQALQLLATGDWTLPVPLQQSLEQVSYHACIAVLALLSQPSQIPAPGGLRCPHESLAWIACNQQKGVSPQVPAVTLHSSPAFSQAHWDLPDPEVTALLLDAASPWLGAPVVSSQVHRWRYSLPHQVYGDLWAGDRDLGLILAGDGFQTETMAETLSPMEGAALSAIAAAETLLSWL
ncbi:NAD(P)/FAD-dependent oxidoreductase [Prochlorothrix hollandica]|uniref:Amine oxidase domain-containing protein n=1 Tax=Prochlorothrix hollandica PCC 9006 = CALU 1027 TaxID=317619 RepID=A0A0M2PZF2_PROHO|nr:FAD-dependent oxidoreductase [Prochlorothrix hollandica]KKJ01535.1 hypothetical protein PROH_04350 [Prochlorothrix hollandica PCC 9006 = CALU 1027]